MSSEIIQARYEDLAQIAAGFRRQADVSAELDQRLQKCLEALEQGGWIGLGAEAFFSEMRGEVLPALGRLYTALELAQDVTLQTSAIMRQAEEEAARLFKGDAENVPGGNTNGAGGGSGGGGGGYSADPIKNTLDTLKRLFLARDGANLAQNLWKAVQAAKANGGGLDEVAAIFTKAQKSQRSFGKVLSWAGKAVNLGSALYENWQENKDSENPIAQIAVGTVVDFVIDEGIGLIGKGIGAGVGFMIGGPAGAVIGAPIGGFIADVANEWLGWGDSLSNAADGHVENFVDQYIGNTVDEFVGNAVDKGAEVVKNVTEQGKQVFTSVANTVQEQARKVDEGIRAVGSAISNFFTPRVALFGG